MARKIVRWRSARSSPSHSNRSGSGGGRRRHFACDHRDREGHDAALQLSLNSDVGQGKNVLSRAQLFLPIGFDFYQ